jgi:hypothetical protein
MRFSRRWSAGLAVAVAMGAGVFGFAPPAAALRQATLAADTWAYTDAHEPEASFVGRTTDTPLGRYTDTAGHDRVSRVYLSFDLSSLAGRSVHRAEFFIQEKKVTDCATATPVEISRTEPISGNPTWNNAPAVVERLGELTRDDCPDYLTMDLLPVVEAALGRGEKRLTVELRMPAAREQDPAAGRLLAYRGAMTVTSNAVPTVESLELYYEKGCPSLDAPAPASRRKTVAAKIADADSSSPGGRFAVWPVDRPEERTEAFGSNYGSGHVRTDLDLSGYADGTVVAFAVQATDNDDTSAWSAPCHLRVDTVAPKRAPVVSSPEYPADGQQHGGSGLPGTFTFDAQGDTDVVSYRWRDRSGSWQTLPAPAPGAAATIRYTPKTSFLETLTVNSVDAAGNIGPETGYEFRIRSTAPGIDVDVAGVGLPSRLTLTSRVTGVTAFGYQIGDADEVRLPATNNTAATDLVFPARGTVTVTVRVYVGGEVAGVGTESVRVSNEPVITSADFSPEHDGVIGREGGFTFTPRSVGVVAYSVRIGNEDERRIDAAADGSATLRWTPAEAGWRQILVRSVNAEGELSDDAYSSVNVIDPRPWVEISDLSAWPRRDGVGVPLTVGIDTSMPEVTEILYRFNDDPQVTVPYEPGGPRFTVVPDHAGDNTIRARQRYTDGTLSPERVFTFEVWSGPLVSSPEYPWAADGGQVGQPGTFTFRPGLPGVEEYVYSFADGDEQTVAAKADGTAQVVLTPQSLSYTTLRVKSRAADGNESQERTYYFYVRDNRVDVYSTYDTTRVGIGTPVWLSLSCGISADLTEYRWRLNDGPEDHLVVADSGVSTWIQVTPDRNGDNVLTVWGVSPDGTKTAETEYTFPVGTSPHVTSAEYPSGQWGGGAGVAGTFHLDGGMPGIVAFEWRVDGQEPATTDADATGAASFSWTPTGWGSHELLVRGRTADGAWTDELSYWIYVNP